MKGFDAGIDNSSKCGCTLGPLLDATHLAAKDHLRSKSVDVVSIKDNGQDLPSLVEEVIILYVYSKFN